MPKPMLLDELTTDCSDNDPIEILLLPVPLELKLSYPKAMLPSPVVLNSSEYNPKLILPIPEELSRKL